MSNFSIGIWNFDFFQIFDFPKNEKSIGTHLALHLSCFFSSRLRKSHLPYRSHVAKTISDNWVITVFFGKGRPKISFRSIALGIGAKLPIALRATCSGPTFSAKHASKHAFGVLLWAAVPRHMTALRGIRSQLHNQVLDLCKTSQSGCQIATTFLDDWEVLRNSVTSSCSCPRMENLVVQYGYSTTWLPHSSELHSLVGKLCITGQACCAVVHLCTICARGCASLRKLNFLLCQLARETLKKLCSLLLSSVIFITFNYWRLFIILLLAEIFRYASEVFLLSFLPRLLLDLSW